MANKIESIFEECLERVLQGESIESCLRSYPEEAAELDPLLRTALGFKWRASSLQPRPEFKAQARIRLEGAQLYTEQRSQPKRPSYFAWQRSWAFALTAVLVILFAGVGTAAAASDSLPDEPLYSVKLATEQTRLAFTFSATGKARLHTQLAENRAMEIVAMAHQGKTEQIVIVAEKLTEHLEKANYAISRVEETEARHFIALPEEVVKESALTTAPAADTGESGEAKQLKELVGGSTSENIAILEDTLEQVPEQIKPALREAIELITEKSPKETQPEPVIEDESKRNDENTDTDEAKPTFVEPTTVKPDESQPSIRKELEEHKSGTEGDGASIKDDDTGTRNQDVILENEAKPTIVKPEQDQPSTQEEAEEINFLLNNH